jgi:hypothetical protein
LARGKQQELRFRRSQAGLCKTRRDRDQLRGRAGFGSGCCFFVVPSWGKLKVQPQVRVQERAAFRRESILWCELTLAIIVVDRKGQDGFP